VTARVQVAVNGLPGDRCQICGAGAGTLHDPECTNNPLAEAVDHPAHYGGADNPYEAIKVIEAWDLDFHFGNTVKYIARAGKKDGSGEIEDLKKGLWYLNRGIWRRER
jgi:hypothetical protein